MNNIMSYWDQQFREVIFFFPIFIPELKEYSKILSGGCKSKLWKGNYIEVECIVDGSHHIFSKKLTKEN